MQGYLGNAENPAFHASVWEKQFSLQHEACCGGEFWGDAGPTAQGLAGRWGVESFERY